MDTANFYDKAASDARFLGATGNAADADRVDGLDSSQIIHGDGEAIGAAKTVPLSKGHLEHPLVSVGGVAMRFECTVFDDGDDVLRIENESGARMELFVESGGDNPNFSQIPSAGEVEFTALRAGDSFHIQASGRFGVLTLEVATVHLANDNCVIQAQGLLTK